VRKIVSLAKSCSINVDDVWEQTQINISKEMLERGEREKQIKWESTQVNAVICFTEVWFKKNLVPIKEATKARSISTLSLFQTVT
jgi:hypothetical protein